MRNRRYCLCTCILGLLGIQFGHAAGIVRAQTPHYGRSQPAVEVPADSRRDFDKIFGAISGRAHITIVAEGIPLHPVLADYQFDHVTRELADTKSMSLEQELVFEAIEFDYDVEQQSPNVFLLRKRYTDPMDLPNVTYDEMVRSLKEICDLTGDASLDNLNSPELRLYQSLTPDQKVKAQTYLSPSDLNADQAAMFAAMPAQAFRVKTPATQQMLECLRKIADPRMMFGWMTLHFSGKLQSGRTSEQFAETGARPFGFYGPVGYGGRELQQPISAGFESTGYGFSILAERLSPPAAPGSPIPTAADQRLAPGMMANALLCTRTLEDAVRPESVDRAVSATPPTNASLGSVDVFVEPAIGSKPVCVFGQHACDRRAYLRALAAVYGLHLSQPERGHYKIGMLKPETLDKSMAPSDQIFQLLPSCLYRAYLSQKAGLRATPGPNNVQPSDPASRAYYYPAIRRLLCLAEPAAEATESETISLQSLNPEASRLIALAYFFGGQADSELFRFRDYRVPDFVSHPESLVIQYHVSARKLLIANIGELDGSGAFQYHYSMARPMPQAPPQSSN